MAHYRKLTVWWDMDSYLYTLSRYIPGSKASRGGTIRSPGQRECRVYAEKVIQQGFKEVACVLGLKGWFKVFQKERRGGAFMVHARDTAHAKAQRLKSTGALIDQKIGRWALRCRMESGEMHRIHCQPLCSDRHPTSRQSLAFQCTS